MARDGAAPARRKHRAARANRSRVRAGHLKTPPRGGLPTALRNSCQPVNDLCEIAARERLGGLGPTKHVARAESDNSRAFKEQQKIDAPPLAR
eukprot:972519-Lingulodinium_polyedra.AAC.1